MNQIKDDDVVTLSRQEVSDIVSEAVTQTFKTIGIDTQSDVLEVQRDMAHLRKWRKSVDTAQSLSFRIVVATLVTGFLGLLWLGFTNSIGR